MTKVVYAGTFDPFTNGHLDIVKRSLFFSEQLIIAVGNNSSKKTLLDAKTRLELINKVLDDEFKGSDRNKITTNIFDGLLVTFAEANNINLIVRGIRSVSDFEYEINLAGINKTISNQLETVFLPTSPDLAVVSSSMVKEIAKYQGDISPFVHPFIRQYLKSIFVQCEV